MDLAAGRLRVRALTGQGAASTRGRIALAGPKRRVGRGKAHAVLVISGAEDVRAGNVREDLDVVDLLAGIDVLELADERAGLSVNDHDAAVDTGVPRQGQVAEGVRFPKLAASDEEIVPPANHATEKAVHLADDFMRAVAVHSGEFAV